MDSIINWFLLIIVFVFDPLAICLVIAANFAFKQLQSSPPIPPQTQQINEEPPVISPPKEEQVVKTESPSKIKDILTSNLSSWRKNKLIQDIKKSSNDDENTIRYM